MCSGTTSVGSSTRGSGNSGRSRTSGAIRGKCRGRREPRSAGAAGGDQQVVEELRREPRLEQLAVDPLKRQVAAECEAMPGERDAGCVDVRLEPPQEPAIDVREQLFSRHPDVGEAG